MELPGPLKRINLDAIPNPFGGGKDLTGVVVAITGGARGIGKATAAALIAEGAKVAIGDLDLDLARETAEELGDSCAAFKLDVTKRDVFREFLDDAQDAFGPLDILINNAGIMLVGDFMKEDDASADLMFDINVKGVLLGCKLALPGMVERNGGQIVNIASLAGKVGLPNLVSYCGTKHAVVGMSDALRAELRGTGVMISTVMPNAVKTELAAGLGDSIIPKATAEEVADAVVWVIKHEKAEATVPRWSKNLTQPVAGLPVDAREGLTRTLGGHKALISTDAKARESYERRARASKS